MPIEARNRNLIEWFTRLSTHQTVLPRFQRYEAWGYKDVVQLLNTVIQGLPAGSLLVLEVGEREPFISRPLEGTPEHGDRINEHLLDGQQRLTALWRSLYNNYEDRTYYLKLSQDAETGLSYYIDSIARYSRPNERERRPFWANDPRQLWERRMIPLDLCRPGVTMADTLGWVHEIIPTEQQDEVITVLSTVQLAFCQFALPFLSLPVTTKPEVALNVFIKMNTSAVQLSPYDVVVAQYEARNRASLHDMISDLKASCPQATYYYGIEELALSSLALLQDKVPGNSTYLDRGFADAVYFNWDALYAGVPRAISFLEEERIFDSARIPTDVVVPVLTALWGLAPVHGDAEGRVRTILRKYLWRAFFSERYERNSSTKALTDFRELKRLLLEGNDATPVTIFDETQFPIPVLEEFYRAGWPKRKDRLPRAVMSLSMRQGGRDLADGSQLVRANISRREYHHLFPYAHLENMGIPERDRSIALNCALVTWKTNRNIAANEPERYLAERRDNAELGETEMRDRLATHMIPYEELISGDYAKFLVKRAQRIFAAMTDVCNGNA